MKSALRILPLAAALIFAACDEGSVLEPDGVDPNLRDEALAPRCTRSQS